MSNLLLDTMNKAIKGNTPVTKEVKKGKDVSKKEVISETIEYAVVEKARKAAVESEVRAYGATTIYAETLNKFWPTFAWYDVAWNSKAKEDEQVKQEAEAFRSALQAAGHSNPRVVWQRVREIAKILREGKKPIALPNYQTTKKVTEIPPAPATNAVNLVPTQQATKETQSNTVVKSNTVTQATTIDPNNPIEQKLDWSIRKAGMVANLKLYIKQIQEGEGIEGCFIKALPHLQAALSELQKIEVK